MSLGAKRFIACHVDEWEWSSWEPPFVHFLLTAVERGAVLHMSITSGKWNTQSCRGRRFDWCPHPAYGARVPPSVFSGVCITKWMRQPSGFPGAVQLTPGRWSLATAFSNGDMTTKSAGG